MTDNRAIMTSTTTSNTKNEPYLWNFPNYLIDMISSTWNSNGTIENTIINQQKMLDKEEAFCYEVDQYESSVSMTRFVRIDQTFPLYSKLPLTKRHIQTNFSDINSISNTNKCTNLLHLSAKTSKNTTNSKKVLIIEDHPICRKYLRKLLETRGHYCEEAPNGLIGLNMVKATSRLKIDDLYLRDYDIILMNLKMPVMNGLESTREIRQLGYTNPIIGVTASIFADDEEAFVKAGVTDVITKPYNMSLFYSITNL